MKDIALVPDNVRNVGITYPKEHKLWLIQSGSGAEFSFTGRKLALTIGCDPDALRSGKYCNYPRIAVFADGRPVVKKVIDKERETFVIADSDHAVTKHIRIVKLSEAAFSLAVLFPAQTDSSAVIAPAPDKSMKMLFIGDSITCGYGVDDCNMFSEFSTSAENAMKSYSMLSADMLGADACLFTYSGFGIISGYTHDGTRNSREVLPPYYGSLGFSHSSIDGVKPQDIPWDCAQYSPDIIVVNMGTNDNSFCIANRESFAEFSSAYVRFIRSVRSSAPHAKIICTIGIIGTETADYLISAADNIGDPNLLTFRFSEQTGLLGYGSNMHPSEDTHIYAAEELAEFIRANIL